MTRNGIVGGPSKYDLSVAFFDVIKGRRRSVTFKVGGPDFPTVTEIPIVINSIEWEDGSGNSWNLKGYASDGIIQGRNVTLYFNSSSRDGWIE